MASIKQSANLFSIPPNSGLGFRQVNWRYDPGVLPCRQRVLGTIQLYLKQNASGEFAEEIAELAAYLENQLFMDAHSKEDYMDGENFRDRLRMKIQQKWFQARSPQEPMHTRTLLPEHNSDQTFVQGNSGTNTFLLGSRKRTFDISIQRPEQFIPNNCSPRDGFSGGEPVDSGPTFSGSVLQYDSEASFESHHIKTQCIQEGDLNSIISSTQSSPSVHTPTTVGESSKAEVFSAPDEMQVHQPAPEPLQFVRQQSQLKLQYDLYARGKDNSSGRIPEESKNPHGFHDASSQAVLRSCYVGSGQHSISSNVWQNLDIKLLCCYITYSRQGGSKIPFLDYLHSQKCSGGVCSCQKYKSLFSHFDNCGSTDCGICGPAIKRWSASLAQTGFRYPRNVGKQIMCGSNCGNRACPETCEDFINPAKYRKLNSLSPGHGSSCDVSMLTDDSNCQQESSPVSIPDTLNLKMVNGNAYDRSISGGTGNIADDNVRGSNCQEAPSSYQGLPAEFEQETASTSPCELKHKVADRCCTLPSNIVPGLCEQNCIAQNEEVMTCSHPEETKPETSDEGFQPAAEKSEKQKVDGITLTDFFSVEEIRQHICSLRQKVDQNEAEEVVGNQVSCSVSENFCQICASDKLAFPPMPIYCSACGMRIKNYGTYYSTKDENRAPTCFCSACHNKARGGNITFCGVSIPKISLVMRKNNLVTEESWVQCDKCEGWQHQICALFNDKRDLGGKAEYVCPKCYLEDLETGTRVPLPRATAFDANKLPQTLLSDHLEKRLFSRLKQERENRAKIAEKCAAEVPEPTDLVVRVVSSVNKRLKVKQQFLDIFPEKNYPAEFPYRSKVILLFQKIEGVDVCLFAMYVQEFGSECSPPNRRCVYISYLDSVKYFRPEIKAASGEALRTFVYHEILVGYLDYCKKRGFATCYIWACPPVKGEDYILYCHPETQKTPRPEKLRQWYQSMLKKASNENIVVNFTNLYEKFFVPTGESNTKVTAARLPYFDGDYWSSVAETMIKKIEQEDVEMKVKKMTRRSLKAMGHSNPSPDDMKDILLMQELGQSISSAKEDFIIVYLQFVCTHCHEVILSGKRWFCNQCKNFQLCQRCHDTDENSELGDTHISSSGQRHALTQEMVNDVPTDTEDNDAIMDNCFLENRHAFLSFCQGNHYQFDSLRRAKHSSMMILYHLHNPIGSNVGVFCSLCLRDVGADPRWRCDICPEFNVCATCHQRNNVSCHNHTLTYYKPTATGGTENKMGKMLGELLDVVLHASRCSSHRCAYPNCILLRRLFSHAHACKVRVSGGCHHCRKAWLVLRMHSQSCKDLECGVPRCMDLKKHAARGKLQANTQSNSLRDICTQLHSVDMSR